MSKPPTAQPDFPYGQYGKWSPAMPHPCWPRDPGHGLPSPASFPCWTPPSLYLLGKERGRCRGCWRDLVATPAPAEGSAGVLVAAEHSSQSGRRRACMCGNLSGDWVKGSGSQEAVITVSRLRPLVWVPRALAPWWVPVADVISILLGPDPAWGRSRVYSRRGLDVGFALGWMAVVAWICLDVICRQRMCFWGRSLWGAGSARVKVCMFVVLALHRARSHSSLAQDQCGGLSGQGSSHGQLL